VLLDTPCPKLSRPWQENRTALMVNVHTKILSLKSKIEKQPRMGFSKDLSPKEVDQFQNAIFETLFHGTHLDQRENMQRSRN
jgi:hypothetical protein